MRGERQMREHSGPVDVPAGAAPNAEVAASTAAQEVSSEELKMLVERRISVLFDGWIEEKRAARSCKRDDFLVRMYEISKAFILQGGKRLRPVACLQAYLLCGGPRTGDLWDAALDIAAAFEILHNSTLVHDDIMDGDVLRRGSPTVWKTLIDFLEAEQRQKGTEAEKKPEGCDEEAAKKRFQEENILFTSPLASQASTFAIIAGNMLVGEGMRLVARASRETRDVALKRGGKRPSVRTPVEYYADADVLVNHGQTLDVRCTEGEEEFINMIALKTGQLFRCAVLAGASLAFGCAKATEDIPQEDVDKMLAALDKYTIDVAAAFQLYDDIMDISRNNTKGHAFASDIRQGKNTLLVSRALRAAPADQAALLRQVLTNAQKGIPSTEEQIGRAVTVIEENSLPSVLETARTLSHSKAINDVLNLWPAPCHVSYFDTLAEFVVDRVV